MERQAARVVERRRDKQSWGQLKRAKRVMPGVKAMETEKGQ